MLIADGINACVCVRGEVLEGDKTCFMARKMGEGLLHGFRWAERRRHRGVLSTGNVQKIFC